MKTIQIKNNRISNHEDILSEAQWIDTPDDLERICCRRSRMLFE